MGKPGIMVYFDNLEPLRLMTAEEQGRIFMAMLDYGQYGAVPEFEGAMAIAWGFLRRQLDADNERYNNTVLQRQYANYCRRSGERKVSYEEWLTLSDCGRVRPVAAEDSRDPYTNTESTTKTISSTKSETTAAPTTKTGLGEAYTHGYVHKPVYHFQEPVDNSDILAWV